MRMIHLTQIRLEHRRCMLTFLHRTSFSNAGAKIIDKMTNKCFLLTIVLLCVSANAQELNSVKLNDVETIPQIASQVPHLAEQENGQPENGTPQNNPNYGKSSKNTYNCHRRALYLLCNRKIY